MTSQEMLQEIRRAESLPSLPTIAIEVLKLTRDDSFRMDDLADVIQRDPAMTAKLLKIINSPLFGMRREVSSIKQAMTLLGARTVRVMVLSFSLVEMCHDEEEGEFDYSAFWRESLSAAVASRLLAAAMGSELKEEAFVGGLLCNIGSLAAARCAAAIYLPVLEAAALSSEPLHVIEQKLISTNHAEISGELLKEWGLPATLTDAIQAHHGAGLDELRGESAEIARLISIGSDIAGVVSGDLPAAELERVRTAALALTGADEEAIDTIFEELASHVRATAGLLSLGAAPAIAYQQIQIEAAQQLAMLTLQTERERDAARDEAARAIASAETDALTTLPNRAAFDVRLTEALKHARQDLAGIALCLFDVDHFKQVNDTHGHAAGDAALRAIGALLAPRAHDEVFLARYGGEEFAMIVTGACAAGAPALAEDLRRGVERLEVVHNEQPIPVRASFGVVRFAALPPDMQPEPLIELADKLLYAAKKTGRNRVVSHIVEAASSAAAA